MKQFLLLIVVFLIACGGTEVTVEDSADAIEESVSETVFGTEDSDAEPEGDMAEGMATVQAVAEEMENEGQNDANTGTDAGDSREEATLIEPGNYSGAATFGVDELSLDMRDVYRVNANAGDHVNVTVTNTHDEFAIDYDIYTHADQRIYVDLFDAGETGIGELVMSSDGYVDIVLSAESYDFSVSVERSSDAGVDGDAANDPTAASPMPDMQASGVLGVPSADGTPDRDCYAHAGAEIAFYAPEGQRFRPTITARTFDAGGNQLSEMEAYYGIGETILPADSAATAVCFTANLNGDADLLYAHYVFNAGAAPDPAAAATGSFDGCALLSIETVQEILAVESSAEMTSTEDGDCEYAFNDVAMAIIFSIGQEGDIDFYRNAGGEAVDGLGSAATYINTQGVSILIWKADDGVVYQLGGLDFVNGQVAADTLIQMAQTINQ